VPTSASMAAHLGASATLIGGALLAASVAARI
jgi:hypothetical protein